MSDAAECSLCHHGIAPTRDSGHYQQVVGYVKLRSRGANEVTLRKDQPVFICRECMAEIRVGQVPGQATMEV